MRVGCDCVILVVEVAPATRMDEKTILIEISSFHMNFKLSDIKSKLCSQCLKTSVGKDISTKVLSISITSLTCYERHLGGEETVANQIQAPAHSDK